MEKFTRSTGLVLFAFVILLIIPVTSCTTDTESDVIYERATQSIDSDASSKKEKDPKKDEDYIDKRKIKRPKKDKG